MAKTNFLSLPIPRGSRFCSFTTSLSFVRSFIHRLQFISLAPLMIPTGDLAMSPSGTFAILSRFYTLFLFVVTRLLERKSKRTETSARCTLIFHYLVENQRSSEVSRFWMRGSFVISLAGRFNATQRDLSS